MEHQLECFRYLGKVNEEELKKGKCGRNLNNLSVVGRAGVEAVLDCELMGSDGYKLTETDATGKTVRELGQMDFVKGKDINLSIDAFWQDKIYKLLEGKKAVVIVSQPENGKVLAMVSSPSYDANNFGYGYDLTTIRSYLEDSQNLPMMNRAISAKYPGSILIIMLWELWKTGQLMPGRLLKIRGKLPLGNMSLKTGCGPKEVVPMAWWMWLKV